VVGSLEIEADATSLACQDGDFKAWVVVNIPLKITPLTSTLFSIDGNNLVIRQSKIGLNRLGQSLQINDAIHNHQNFVPIPN